MLGLSATPSCQLTRSRRPRPAAAGRPAPTTLAGMGAVALEPELVFQGVDDALDPLADPTKRSPPVRLVTAVGPDQHRAELVHSLGEPVVGQALVGGDDHPRGAAAPGRWPTLAARPRPRARPAWGWQDPGHRHAVRGRQQVQLEAPIPARVASVIAVAGPAGQVTAPDRLPRGAARHRGGVQQPPLVPPRRRGVGQVLQRQPQRWRGGAQPPVVPDCPET